MVCLSRALPALLGASVVAATNPNINPSNPFNNLFPSPAPQQTQIPDVTKSYAPNPPRTDHVLRDAPAATDSKTATQTSTDPAAATTDLAGHTQRNCTAMCQGYCRKPSAVQAKIEAHRHRHGCPECQCNGNKPNDAGGVSAMGALKTVGIAVVGVVGVMAFL